MENHSIKNNNSLVAQLPYPTAEWLQLPVAAPCWGRPGEAAVMVPATEATWEQFLAPGSWLWPGLVLEVVGIWKVNQ